MADHVLSTTIEVIDALGGTQAVADLTGRSYAAAFNWRGFKSFPSNTYLIMTAALSASGKDAPASLWGMTEAPGEASAAERASA